MSGFSIIFSVAIFSQIFHSTIPIIAQPMKNKSHLPTVFTAAICTTFMLYTILGVIVALYYGAKVSPTCTMNWVTYKGGFSEPNGWTQFVR